MCFYNLPKTFLHIILLQFIVISSVLMMTGCYTDKKTSTGTIDIIVIFKIDVPVEKANSILFEKEYIFTEGIGSSKDKNHSLNSGHKYIVQVPKDRVTAFIVEMKNIPQVNEVYQAE